LRETDFYLRFAYGFLACPHCAEYLYASCAEVCLTIYFDEQKHIILSNELVSHGIQDTEIEVKILTSKNSKRTLK